MDLFGLVQRKQWCILALLVATTGNSLAAKDAKDPNIDALRVGETSDSALVVDIPDAALRKAVEDVLGKEPGDSITRREMATLRELRYLGRVRPVRQLKGIEYAVNLRVLELNTNFISDVSPLAGLTSLTKLDLGINAISDVSPLAGMASLTRLNLAANAISDVSPLAHMPSLTTLWLGSNAISDVSPLAGMSSLTWLDLGANAISDVSPLSAMASLTRLNLAANAISDVSPLSAMASLTRLYLYSNAISDVSPLVANHGLGHGDSVDLNGNPLSQRSREVHIPALLQRGVDVDFSKMPPSLSEILDVGLRRAAEATLLRTYVTPDLANLKWLDASNLEIENLSGLEGAEGLVLLNLDRNRVTDVAPLAEIRLSGLTLTHNRGMVDWTPLAGMIDLDYLALDGNSLLEVPPLPPYIKYLYLAENSISDIAPLAMLLPVELDLSANAVTSLAPLEQWDLEYLHVDGNQIADLSPLTFERLRELHFANNMVADISPLLNGEELLMADVRRNPLADDALAVLDTLRERGVTVLAGEIVPYFPAAGGARKGFVRIVNRSDQNGHVFIEAVDDAGARARASTLEHRSSPGRFTSTPRTWKTAMRPRASAASAARPPATGGCR